MAETVFLTRTLGGFRAANAIAVEALERIPAGQEIKAEITRPRNLRHHRKFFALLQVIFPHQQTYSTMRAFRAALTCAAGHCEVALLPDGRTILVPESISFGKLDQAAFEQFYERALDVVLTRILPGIDRDDVTREVDEVLAGREAA
jgi:hypothetical protein